MIRQQKHRGVVWRAGLSLGLLIAAQVATAGIGWRPGGQGVWVTKGEEEFELKKERKADPAESVDNLLKEIPLDMSEGGPSEEAGRSDYRGLYVGADELSMGPVVAEPGKRMLVIE